MLTLKSDELLCVKSRYCLFYCKALSRLYEKLIPPARLPPYLREIAIPMDQECTMLVYMPQTFFHDDYKLFFGDAHTENWNVDTDGKKAGAVICLILLSIVMYAVLYLYKRGVGRL